MFGRLIVLGAVATFAVSSLQARAADPHQPDEEDFVSLFDGKSLDGWRINEHPESARVENGALVIGGGPTAHLFYDGPVEDHDFKNFELKLEANTKPGAN